MVDDDVAESTDGVVEVAAILDAEVLGHRDLHRGDEVAVPHGLEQHVREAQVDDLLGTHLPEVVVDAQELALVDVLVQLPREVSSRVQVVPERLLHDHASVRRQACLGKALNDPAEQERRDLEVEDRHIRPLDRLAHASVRGRVREVAGDVREPV